MTRIGILFFCIVVLAGPLYTVENHNTVINTISELGAQYTNNNFIMIAGFVLLGMGMIADGLKNYSTALLPFLIFAFFMALAGLLPHKPVVINIVFNPVVHEVHKILATLSGISITVGFIWQGLVLNKRLNKIVCINLAIVCTVFPMLMLFFAEYQGLIQRLMYAQVFIWLWFYYPLKVKSQTG